MTVDRVVGMVLGGAVGDSTEGEEFVWPVSEPKEGPMSDHSEVPFQRDLFETQAAGFDSSYSALRRIELDAHSWVDFADGWVTGADALFESVHRARDWKQRSRWLYERSVKEPRLTAP